MEHPLIHDRGRGPELVGTRTTIYNLVPYFLKPEWTEAGIADANRVSIEQVAAMRAYFLAHYADVMTQHERIEERIRKGMEEQAKPEFQSRFWWNRKRMESFREWLSEYRRVEAASDGTGHRRDVKSLLSEFRNSYESSNAVGVAG